MIDLFIATTSFRLYNLLHEIGMKHFNNTETQYHTFDDSTSLSLLRNTFTACSG